MAKENNAPTQVEVGGIAVAVDMAYVRSWAGVMQAKKMASTELPETERFLAMVEYYEHVVANIDEVTEAAGERPADEVFALLSEAVKAATPKN